MPWSFLSIHNREKTPETIKMLSQYIETCTTNIVRDSDFRHIYTNLRSNVGNDVSFLFVARNKQREGRDYKISRSWTLQ